MIALMLSSVRDRRATARQGGFALAAMLFVILFTSLVVVALLGLTMSTTWISQTSDIGDKRSRAADSALEAALNQVARDESGNLGYPPDNDPGTADEDCTVDGTFNVGKQYDDSGSLIANGRDVWVTCTALNPSAGRSTLIGVAKVNADGQISLDGVKVIGSQYNGDRSHGSPNDWANWPWTAALGANHTGELAANGATVVHEGPAPLSVSADLQVRNGSAGVLTGDLTDLTPLDAAIGVTGTYAQGDPGLLSTRPDYDAGDTSRSCGRLQLSEEYPDLRPGVALRSGGGSACTDPDSLGLSWQTPGITSPAPFAWTVDAVAANRRTVSTACTNPKVIQAGSYDKTQTANLNTLFRTCSGLIHFQPGDYWLDVDSGSGSDRNDLIINNPNVRVVFGTLSGTGAATDFPQACNPTANGVSITLSPRTAIRHGAGRLAICGKNGPGSVAIWQANSANVGWQPTEPTLDNGGFNDGGGIDGILAPGDGLTIVGQNPCTFWDASCFATRSVTLRNLIASGDPGEAALSSMQIMVKGEQSRADGGGSGVRVEVYDQAGQRICSSSVGKLPKRNSMIAYEVLGPGGNCRSLLTRRSQLINASVKVLFDMSPNCDLDIIFGGGGGCVGGPQLDLDYVAVRVPWMPTTSTPDTFNPGYSNPGGWLTANDGQESGAFVNCNFALFQWCEGADNRPFYFGIRDLTDINDPESAPLDATLESAGVVIKGRATNVDYGGSSTTVLVTFGGAPVAGQPTTCQVTIPGLPHDDLPLYVNLLQGSCVNGGAPSTWPLHHPSQLVGAKIRVQTNLDRDGWCFWPFCSGWGATIDSLSVSTTVNKPPIPPGTPDEEISANAYEGPRHPFLFTSGSDAVVGIFGTVEIPRADLDIHWNGPTITAVGDYPTPGSKAVLPLFNGSGPLALVVNGIGSSTGTDFAGNDIANGNAEVGALCCAPAKPSERRVKLLARDGGPGGTIIGTATAVISDQSVDPKHPGLWAPGQRLAVEEWVLCTPEDGKNPQRPDCYTA